MYRIQEHIADAGLAGGIRRILRVLPVRPDFRVVGCQSQHREQEEGDENHDHQERLTSLRVGSSETGATMVQSQGATILPSA
jgi:hypothetical protein